jgi:non-ribosomal peptide synthase protein (TIGR01720 family)
LNGETGEELKGMGAAQMGFNYLGRMVRGGGEEGKEWEVAREVVGGSGDEEMALRHCVEVNAMAIEQGEGVELVAQWRWAPAVVSEEEVRELAEGWFHMLEKVVEHARQEHAGGLTPSDVPLVGLSQAEIERLEQELEKELSAGI